MKKKILSIFILGCLLLSGCSNIHNSTTTVEPEVVGKNNILDTSVEIYKYSKNDKICKALKELGYVPSEGYTKVPTKDFFYPESVIIDNKIINVFLNLKDAKNVNYTDDMSFTNGLKGPILNFGASLDGFVETESAVADMGAFIPSEPVFYPENFNTSEYHGVIESGYLSVKNNPLSTFAADVDTASYTNFRRLLKDSILYEHKNNSSLHDIRIEEMLNYFSYNYPNSDDKFTVNTEIANTPWNEDTKLLVVNVKAKELKEYEGSNLVFLIDTSGSMNSIDKLELLKKSLELLVNELSEKDKISIVTYSGDSKVIIEGVPGNKKEKIIDAIKDLNAHGGTNGEGGIKKAYEIASKYKEEYSNSRVIMCTDGDLNVGISSEDELIDLIKTKKETGVYLSVLGFGEGNYKDNKLESLANNGNGNYHYIDTLVEGNKVLVEEMLSTLVTLGDDVKFQLEFNPEYIKGYRKIGYENRDLNDEDFTDDTKDGGEVGYGHEVTVVYELVFNDSKLEIKDTDLKYQETISKSSNDLLTISIRYKDHGESTSNLIEIPVSKDSLNNKVSDDWMFISNLVSFGLIVNESNYKGTSNLDDIINNLQSLTLKDEYKLEFLSLVRCFYELSK